MINSACKKFSLIVYLKILFLGLLANITFSSVSPAQNKNIGKVKIPSTELDSSNSKSFKVLDISYNPINKGLNYLHITVRNETDNDLDIGLDLITSSPILYLGKWQWQYAFPLFSKEEKTFELPIIYRGLTSTPALEMTFGVPQINKWGFIIIIETYFNKKFFLEIERNSETVLSKFIKYDFDSSCLAIYAYKDYLTEMKVLEIYQKRKLAYHKLKQYLSVEKVPKVRFLFYPDHETKKSETGHTGIGWAINNTIVEVYNDSTSFDPFHELVHIIANKIGNPPAMFSEGLAIYLSELFGSDALKYFGHEGKKVNAVAKKLSEEKKLISLDSLIKYNEIGGDDFSITYPQAASFVKYLIERFGLVEFKYLYSMLKIDLDKTSIYNRQIIKEVYQESLLELEKDWLNNLSESPN